MRQFATGEGEQGQANQGGVDQEHRQSADVVDPFA